jgi:hypothetical protein
MQDLPRAVMSNAPTFVDTTLVGQTFPSPLDKASRGAFQRLSDTLVALEFNINVIVGITN